MQRTYQSNYSRFHHHCDLAHQTAFHESGHAASIYLGNKEKQLPPVFFQIQINKSITEKNTHYAEVTEGRLIQNLSSITLEHRMKMSPEEKLSFQSAYEADVINLLVGPLAEAKYVSIRDDEAFNFNLMNTHSLHYYGGSSDVEKAYAYLKYFIPSPSKREEKMLELFTQAYLFIENSQNWKCILNLAHYILDSDKNLLSCEEAIEIFEQCLN